MCCGIRSRSSSEEAGTERKRLKAVNVRRGHIFTLIRAMCMDLIDPSEKPSVEPRNGVFLRSLREQMRGFLDLLIRLRKN
jgi:hypothetical protein